jgi:hypothetical protein
MGIFVGAQTRRDPPEVRAAAGWGKQQVMFARWDVVMNKDGAEKVRKALEAVKTESRGYEAFRGSSEKLRLVLKDAMVDGEVLKLPERFTWPSMNMGQVSDRSDFSLESAQVFGHLSNEGKPPGTWPVLLHSGQNGPVFVEPRKEAVRMKMAGTLHDVVVQRGGERSVKQGAMRFTGDIPVGESVVFVGRMGQGEEFFHVSIWETFSCSREEQEYVRPVRPKEWVNVGLAEIKRQADRALAWNARAKQSGATAAAKWEKRLPNGAVVRLLGASMPGQWLGCWWDGDGRPAVGASSWAQRDESMSASDLVVAIQVEDPSAHARDAGRQMTMGNSTGDARRSLSTTIASDAKLELGVDAGPWKDAGPIKIGESLEVQRVMVKLTKVTQANPKMGHSPGSSWLECEQTSRADVAVRIMAIDKQGREVEDRRTLSPVFRRDDLEREIMHTHTHLVEAVPEDIASFKVMWRERAWTSFEGFALLPVESPDGASPATRSDAGLRKAPAPGTPERFNELMRQAVENGDTKRVRTLMAADTELEKKLADDMAEMLVSGTALRMAAEKKFGVEETETALLKRGMAIKLQPAPGMEWKVEGDSAQIVSTREDVKVVAGPGSRLLRVNGEWRADMRLPADFPAERRAEIEGRLEQHLARQAAAAKARRDVATEIADGKYKDAYEARDALRARMK